MLDHVGGCQSPGQGVEGRDQRDADRDQRADEALPSPCLRVASSATVALAAPVDPRGRQEPQEQCRVEVPRAQQIVRSRRLPGVGKRRVQHARRTTAGKPSIRIAMKNKSESRKPANAGSAARSSSSGSPERVAGESFLLPRHRT